MILWFKIKYCPPFFIWLCFFLYPSKTESEWWARTRNSGCLLYIHRRIKISCSSLCFNQAFPEQVMNLTMVGLWPVSEADELPERKGGIKYLFSAKARLSFHFFPYLIYDGPWQAEGCSFLVYQLLLEDCRQYPFHELWQHTYNEQPHSTELNPDLARVV